MPAALTESLLCEHFQIRFFYCILFAVNSNIQTIPFHFLQKRQTDRIIPVRFGLNIRTDIHIPPIVTSLIQDDYLYGSDFRSLINSSQHWSNKAVALGNQKYLYSYVKSSDTDWTYITLELESKVLQRVMSIKLLFIYIMVFLLFICGAVIYYFMNLNYKPIYLLKQFTEKIWKDNKTHHNELETVQHALAFLNSQNSELYARIEDSAIAAKEYFLFQLIKGKFQSLEALQANARTVGLSFTKSSFRIIIFNIKHPYKTNEFPKEPVLEVIENSLNDHFEGYARDHMDQKNVVMVMAGDPDCDEPLKAMLASIQAELKIKFKITATIGIGKAYEDILSIPKSYIEAMTAIDYRLIKGIGQIIAFDEIAIHPSTNELFPHFAIDQLKLHIRQGNTDLIDRFLQTIIHFLKNDKPSIFVAKMVSFEIINSVVRTMEEMNKQQAGVKLDYPDVFLLSEFETVDELAEIVRRLIPDIGSNLEKIKNRQEATLINKMTDYIQNHYSECDFTIQQMAEHFHMSQAGLSQYFKEHYGNNLLDYETNLKLEKAKQLLSSSKLPMKDIALEVGYYNVSSFIRRFKQIVGITPGEFRKQFTEGTD